MKILLSAFIAFVVFCFAMTLPTMTAALGLLSAILSVQVISLAAKGE